MALLKNESSLKAAHFDFIYCSDLKKLVKKIKFDSAILHFEIYLLYIWIFMNLKLIQAYQSPLTDCFANSIIMRSFMAQQKDQRFNLAHYYYICFFALNSIFLRRSSHLKMAEFWLRVFCLVIKHKNTMFTILLNYSVQNHFTM